MVYQTAFPPTRGIREYPTAELGGLAATPPKETENDHPCRSAGDRWAGLELDTLPSLASPPFLSVITVDAFAFWNRSTCSLSSLSDEVKVSNWILSLI